MNYLKQVSYIELKDGFQTYIFKTNLDFVRYKFFPTKEELNDALEKAKNQGWKVINATKTVNRLNRQTKK
ncbi:hypothetical protein [Crocosphaera chwakensis]|uniref:Uncharacterized protein n=1 Tax=Crocosphaera chwakensis CCY0110 TaxID=391612 RepID=A3IY34_9CHRO|nr:hypothetical protein [Crocosphaera chwakensis]EAZ88610.1 hypothetical protein CY0110_31435 [Crocosphaera chwakensis CCY0110]